MKKKWIRALLWLALAAALVLLDQWTKGLAVRYLKGSGIRLLPNVLHLVYVENRGALFGIGQNSTLLFCVMTPVAMAFIVYLYFKTPEEKKFFWMRLCCMLANAGAVGNLIDRLKQGYVVDMIYFVPINFPVFNVADIYVTCGIFLIAGMLLFWKELGERMFPEKKPAGPSEKDAAALKEDGAASEKKDA